MNCGNQDDDSRQWQGLKASIFTLGCRLNQADSAFIANDLRTSGFEIVSWEQPADLLVVNSCTVTTNAARKTRQMVRRGRRRCPRAFLVIAGCDADMSRQRWSLDGDVDLVVGNIAKERLTEHLPFPLRRSQSPIVVADAAGTRGEGFAEHGVGFYPEKTRAHLKIQEGCNFHCSYCIVPKVRGSAVSRAWDDILREAESLLSAGYRELVLTGVNIATYRHRGRNLADLSRRLLDIGGGFRLRLSSTEPGPVLSDVVRLMSEESRLCRFLHIPLQYAHDHILARMNRRYRVAEYAALANEASAQIPGLCLGSDIIVGFPGETDELFSQCCRTLRELPINHLHVFTYSKREGTAAVSFPDHVSGDVACVRAAGIRCIGDTKAEAFASSQVGKTLPVLTEQRDAEGLWGGWSDNYLRVHIAGKDPESAKENQLVNVLITKTLAKRQLSGILNDQDGRKT